MAAKMKVDMRGLTAERSWASTANHPAIRALSEGIEFIGAVNSNRASAERAVKAVGMGRAFDSVIVPHTP